MLVVFGIAAFVLTGGVAGLVAWTYARADTSNVGELSFDNAVRVPPLLEPTIGADGVKHFELNVQAGESEFRPGVSTRTWGVNGPYLGPTIRASKGDRVEVDVHNGVDETTTMHWHGMHLPAAMDGGPHQPIAPGESWTPSWTIDQPAATLWYHPHLHGATAEHVYRGVSGLFLLEDERTGTLGLPNTYGVDDVPLVIQDKRFDDDGQLASDEPFMSSLGVLGDEILVNGTLDPHLEVSHELMRFRVLNASNARTFDLGFTDGRSFHLIGTDSGLLAEPTELERLQVSPGERVEILVSFSPGDDVTLRSFAPDLGMPFIERFNGGDDSFDLIQFRATDTLQRSEPIPQALVDQDDLDEADAKNRRSFSLSDRSIDDKRMNMDRIDQTVTVDTTEIWEVENESGTPHNFHVHDVRFQILDIDGEEPPPHLRGWKDTVAVLPSERVRFVVRFTDYTDPSAPYMFHCHILRHEDDGMMGQFVVVEPGQEASLPSEHHDHS